MNNYDFATEELVYYRCKEVEPEMMELCARTLNSCGNRYTDDVIQDTYIKAIKIFLNANIIVSDFRKQLLSLCEEVCFQYYWSEKKNYAKPRKYIGKPQDEAEELDTFLWEKARDENGDAERRMIALESISAIKQYKGQWLSYSNAKDFIATFKFKNKEEFDAYCKSDKKIKNIPDNPDKVYKTFKDWDDWLSIRRYTFEECVNWVRNNVSAKSKEEWYEKINELPAEIPANPEDYYKDSGWATWDYFLGYVRERELYLSYAEAQEWVEENLWRFDPKEKHWNEYVSNGIDGWPALPDNIPKEPSRLYNGIGWVSWFRWFGKQNYNKRLYPISYHECARWVKQNLALVSTAEEWERFVKGEYPIKKPDYIPPNPHIVFKNIGWHGWRSFLPINGMMTKYIGNLFGVDKIRIKYNGENIWVKPIQMFNDTISGRVLTAFCSVAINTEVKFNSRDIIVLPGNGRNYAKGVSAVKKRLANKYKIAV